MSLNKYRNQPCPCKSGIKFKHCCLQGHYDQQTQVVTPVQKQENTKEQMWYKKQYDRVSASVGVPSA